MSIKFIRSPSYPSMSLEEATEAVGKIEAQYRGSAVDRENAAKLLGYSGLSGPANKSLAALASYGLVERAGKGMMRVTSRARSILHADSDSSKARELREAALEPKLFQELKERFQDVRVPPLDGVVTHLNREGFNPKAVAPAAKAFVTTMQFIESLEDGSGNLGDHEEVTGSEGPAEGYSFSGASVGDFVQWESNGALQFEMPRRVRWVAESGAWLAVEGSEESIPTSQIILEERPSVPATPQKAPPPEDANRDVHQQPVKKGHRKAVFPVSEGDVTFVFPENMTLDGIEELEAYLAVFLKKEKRNASST